MRIGQSHFVKRLRKIKEDYTHSKILGKIKEDYAYSKILGI
jgi:hypothetical protein